MEQLLLWQPSEERVPQANLRAFIEVVKEEWKLEIPDGARLPYVKQLMGHSSIQVTVDIYGHLIPGADFRWIDRLDSPAGPQPTATQARPSSEHEAGYVLQVNDRNGVTEDDHTTDARTTGSALLLLGESRQLELPGSTPTLAGGPNGELGTLRRDQVLTAKIRTLPFFVQEIGPVESVPLHGPESRFANNSA